MNMRSFSILLIIMALVVPGIGAMITYSLMDDPVKAEEVTPDTGPLARQFSTLAHAKLSSMEESTLEEIENELTRDMGLWVSSSRITFKDNRITVLSSRVQANQIDLQVKVPVPPANLEGDLGRLVTNSLMHGDMGTLPLLPGIKTDVEVDLLIEPDDGSTSFEETIAFSTEVVDPERGLIKLIQILEADMNHWGSGMQRDMEYMLTTLTRYRSTRDYGAGKSDSSFDVLNEGDIELAFNIALALRLTRWTGQVPQNLVEAIDRFFKDQTVTTDMNPTGYRFWGESEKESFSGFYVDNVGMRQRRSIGEIIRNAVDVGHGDSADIMGKYLWMDHAGDPNLNILDMESPLEEDQLLSQGQRAPVVDSTALEHHPSYPDSDGILVLPRDDYLPSDEKTPPRLIPKLEPIRDYMVLGRDFKAHDFDEPKAWFTNANHTKPLSELEVWAAGAKRKTRCGAIPPPPKPSDHSFKLEWEFSIEGTFDVEASYEGFGGNAPLDRSSIVKSVNFGFPLRIHTWFLRRPWNDLAYDFVNINTGKMYWTDIVTGWQVTTIANATEFFEDQVYPELKTGLSIMTQFLKTLQWYMSVPVLDDAAVRKLSHEMAMSTEQQLENWARDNVYGAVSKIWFDNWTIRVDLKPEDLGMVRLDGHHLRFSYSELRDVLYIRSSLVDDPDRPANIELAIHGIKTKAFRVEGEIEASGITVDISPYDDEYGIIGDRNGYYISDGPKHINQPDQDVASLLVERGWMIGSPSTEVAAWDVPGPYVLADDDLESNITISFVLADGQGSEPKEVLRQVQKIVSIPGRLGESQVSMVLDQLAGIAIENDVWFGIRTTSTGDDVSHPLSRTLLLHIDENPLSSHSEIRTITWQSLSASGCINSMVRDMIWGASVDTYLEVDSPVRSIMMEEVPSWTASGSLIGENDMMYVTHTLSRMGQYEHENLQSMNVASVSQNDPNRYHNKADGWELSGIEGLSILW